MMNRIFRRAGFPLSGLLLAGAICITGCRQNQPHIQAGKERQRTGAGTGARATAPTTFIGLQYETYFTPLNTVWSGNKNTGVSGLQRGTEEAIPILGKYSSYDVSALEKHERWFEDMGVNWLLIDWSNMLWMKPAWEKHTGATAELEKSTKLLFETYSRLQKEGRHPPKLVIMLGLQNGPPVPNATVRLNHIIAWLTAHFLHNPQYKHLWLDYEGKPLLTILYNVNYPCSVIAERTKEIVAPGWTVRWMGSQLQDTHVEACGFWSWMDGVIPQMVTYHGGVPEEVVVTPSCFPMPAGWLDPRAVGRDHGAPYIESWRAAFKTHPRFIQIHQWNEFAGQARGQGAGPHHNIYGDEYSPELSDDLEPTQLNKCGYRGCGGWGYYYMNLTEALISLYRKQTPDITVMALSGPFHPAVVRKDHLSVRWVTIGEAPRSYELRLDGKVVARNIDSQRYQLNLEGLRPGKHSVTLVANGVHTYFDLNPEKRATRSVTPLPVVSTLEFTYSPRS